MQTSIIIWVLPTIEVKIEIVIFGRLEASKENKRVTSKT
jgi:hypothetical protein